MRSSLMLLALVSFPALACPNLAGVYKVCRTNGSPVNQVAITQTIVNKISQYTFTTSEVETTDVREDKYVADGKSKITTETDADSGIAIRTSTTTSCIGDVLNIKMDAKVDGEVFANITIQTSKKGIQLTQTFSGVSMGEPVNETVVCE